MSEKSGQTETTHCIGESRQLVLESTEPKENNRLRPFDFSQTDNNFCEHFETLLRDQGCPGAV